MMVSEQPVAVTRKATSGTLELECLEQRLRLLTLQREQTLKSCERFVSDLEKAMNKEAENRAARNKAPRSAPHSTYIPSSPRQPEDTPSSAFTNPKRHMYGISGARTESMTSLVGCDIQQQQQPQRQGDESQQQSFNYGRNVEYIPPFAFPTERAVVSREPAASEKLRLPMMASVQHYRPYAAMEKRRGRRSRDYRPPVPPLSASHRDREAKHSGIANHQPSDAPGATSATMQEWWRQQQQRQQQQKSQQLQQQQQMQQVPFPRHSSYGDLPQAAEPLTSPMSNPAEQRQQQHSAEEHLQQATSAAMCRDGASFTPSLPSSRSTSSLPIGSSSGSSSGNGHSKGKNNNSYNDDGMMENRAWGRIRGGRTGSWLADQSYYHAEGKRLGESPSKGRRSSSHSRRRSWQGERAMLVCMQAMRDNGAEEDESESDKATVLSDPVASAAEDEKMKDVLDGVVVGKAEGDKGTTSA